MLEAGIKPAHCAKILGHYMQTFFSTYARFIDADADADAEQAATGLPSGKVSAESPRSRFENKSIRSGV